MYLDPRDYFTNSPRAAKGDPQRSPKGDARDATDAMGSPRRVRDVVSKGAGLKGGGAKGGGVKAGAAAVAAGGGSSTEEIPRACGAADVVRRPWHTSWPLPPARARVRPEFRYGAVGTRDSCDDGFFTCGEQSAICKEVGSGGIGRDRAGSGGSRWEPVGSGGAK